MAYIERMELTATQIDTLTAAGGSRWQKSGHDRIYFNIDTIPGIEIQNPHRKGGYLTLDGSGFSNRCEMAIRSSKFWVDVTTGETHSQVSDDRKVTVEVATLVERFENLVSGLLATQETGAPEGAVTASEPAAVTASEPAAETIRVLVADHVSGDRRRRLIRNLVNHYGAQLDGDVIILPAEVWAPPREYGEHAVPGRWPEIPRTDMFLVSQGNLVRL